ncbi:MAG: hypothetical protein DLM72_11685 [Candidatus Nitrosopolaris wilkensis]|nr:MAG: hypothetical protein DLM72_11685 [Candidatus Nitrosopolaris wilkensis]
MHSKTFVNDCDETISFKLKNYGIISKKPYRGILIRCTKKGQYLGFQWYTIEKQGDLNRQIHSYSASFKICIKKRGNSQ